MLTKKAATAVNYFEYFSPTPHAVHYSAHCSEETEDEDRRRLCQEDRQKYRAAFDRQQPHKKHKSNSNNNEREYKTCWKHKYWQHTRMLPQTVKLFRFMNINAHPSAKGGGVGCGSSAGRGWTGGQRSHHKRAAWEYRTQRRLQAAASATLQAWSHSCCCPRRN